MNFLDTLYSLAAVWRPGGERKPRQPSRFWKYFNRCIDAAGYIYFRTLCYALRFVAYKLFYHLFQFQ